MIKIVGRFMIILLVACLVAGGLYWLVQANPSLLDLGEGAQGMRGGRQRGQGSKDLPGTEDDLELMPFEEVEGGGGEHIRQPESLDARAISGILRNLLIIALTTLAVLGIQKAFAVIKRRRQARAVPPASS